MGGVVKRIVHAPGNFIGSVKHKGQNSLASIGIGSGGGHGSHRNVVVVPWYGPEGPPGGPQGLDPNWSATGPYGLYGEDRGGMMGGMTRPAPQMGAQGRVGKSNQRGPAPYQQPQTPVGQGPANQQAMNDYQQAMGQGPANQQAQQPMNPQLMQQIAGMLGRR